MTLDRPAAILALVLLQVAPATAQSNRNVSLNWVRSPTADGCTSGRRVAQRVESYFESDDVLEESRFRFLSSSSAHLAIEARVGPYKDGWEVEIGVSKGDEKVPGAHFVQRARSCHDLEVQAALVIAQLLDSATFQDPAATTPGEAPQAKVPYRLTPHETTPTIPVRVPRLARSRSSSRPDWRMMVGGTADRGVFPSTGVGFQIGLSMVAPSIFPIELHAAYNASPSSQQFSAARAGLSARSSTTLRGGRLALLACPARFHAGRLDFGACGGISATAIHVQLEQFRKNGSAWVSWFGIDAVLRPSFNLTNSVGFWLEASASFTVANSSSFDSAVAAAPKVTLYRAPAQSARLAVGVSYLF